MFENTKLQLLIHDFWFMFYQTVHRTMRGRLIVSGLRRLILAFNFDV